MPSCGDTDDGAVGQILRGLADRPAADMADGLDAALGSSAKRDDAAFLVVRSR